MLDDHYSYVDEVSKLNIYLCSLQEKSKHTVYPPIYKLATAKQLVVRAKTWHSATLAAVVSPAHNRKQTENTQQQASLNVLYTVILHNITTKREILLPSFEDVGSPSPVLRSSLYHATQSRPTCFRRYDAPWRHLHHLCRSQSWYSVTTNGLISQLKRNLTSQKMWLNIAGHKSSIHAGH